MDEEELEQPRKKITLSNFFDSIVSVEKVADRALKKTNSNLDIINQNKSLIEALSKSFDDLKVEIREIKEYITIERDIKKDESLSQEDREQKLRRLERTFMGGEGSEDSLNPEDKKQQEDFFKKALQNPNILQIIAGGVLGAVSFAGGTLLSAFGIGTDSQEQSEQSEKKGGGFGGFIDFLTDDLTDFDRQGVDERTGAGKPKTYGKFFGGLVDFVTANAFDLDKSGDFLNSREDLERMKELREERREERKQNKAMKNIMNFNLGGPVFDNDNDTTNNNEDSVPAMLTPGEFVVTKDAVDKIGVDTLKGLNASVGATNKPTLMEGTTDSSLGIMSLKFAGFGKGPIEQTMRMTDEGLEKTYFDDTTDLYELSSDDTYFREKNEMLGSGLKSDAIAKYFSKEITEDGTEETFTEEHKHKTQIVSIGIPDLVEHRHQLMSEINKLKGFEKVTFDQFMKKEHGIPQELLLPILYRSDASKATGKKRDKAMELDRKEGVQPSSAYRNPTTFGYRTNQIEPPEYFSYEQDISSKSDLNFVAKGFNQGGLVEGVKKMYSSEIKEIEQNKSKNNLKPLLDMIGSGESDNVGGYSAMFPSESYPEMLDMSINELIEFQKEKLKDGRKSVAVGRYQMLYPEDYAAAAGLPLTAKFTPDNQDKMVIAYLKKNRKLNEFLNNEITNEQFSEELSQEFGTFKSSSGFVLPDNTGSIDFPMMVPVFNKIKNNLKSETESSDDLRSVIESKSNGSTQSISVTPKSSQNSNIVMLPMPMGNTQPQPVIANDPVIAPVAPPEVTTTPVASTMSTVSFINMISNKQLSIG